MNPYESSSTEAEERVPEEPIRGSWRSWGLTLVIALSACYILFVIALAVFIEPRY